jgi:hypothetical protein
MIKTLAAQFEEHDRRIFWTLSVLALVALASYLYFLSVSVFAVVSRRSAESEFRSLNARIAQLESTYASLDKEIDLALAHERGFVDIAVPQYLSLGKTENVLSLRGEPHAR